MMVSLPVTIGGLSHVPGTHLWARDKEGRKWGWTPLSHVCSPGKGLTKLRYLKLVHHLADPAALLPDDVPVKVKGHLHFNGDRNQCLQGRRLKLGLRTRAERHHRLSDRSSGGTKKSQPCEDRPHCSPRAEKATCSSTETQRQDEGSSVEADAGRANARTPASAPDCSRPLAEAQRSRTGQTRERDVGRGGGEAAGRQRLAPTPGLATVRNGLQSKPTRVSGTAATGTGTLAGPLGVSRKPQPPPRHLTSTHGNSVPHLPPCTAVLRLW